MKVPERPENPKKDQKYPMLRENFNQTSKRRIFFETLVVPSRRPFSEKNLLKIRQLYPLCIIEQPFLEITDFAKTRFIPLLK